MEYTPTSIASALERRLCAVISLQNLWEGITNGALGTGDPTYRDDLSNVERFVTTVRLQHNFTACIRCFPDICKPSSRDWMFLCEFDVVGTQYRAGEQEGC